jgi:hypothetical protein
MGKIIKKGVVTRQKGKLYYIDASGNVCEAAMKKGGTRGHRTCKAAAPKKKAAAKKRVVKKAAPKKKAAPRKRAVAKRAPAKRKVARAKKRK